MKFIYQTLLKGLVAIVPVAVTVYVLLWIIVTLEAILGGVFRNLLPNESWYVPGMGVFIGLMIVFLVGLLLEAWVLRRLWLRVEHQVDRVPLLRSIYSAIRNVMQFIAGSQAGNGGKNVVMVSIGDPPVRLLGIVTRQSVQEAPKGLGHEGDIAVYLPMSYQIGGFTVFLRPEQTEDIDMTVEEGLRYAMTASIGQGNEEEEDAEKRAEQ